MGKKSIFNSYNPAQVSIPIRKVVEEALAYNAGGIVIAHNHPGGKAEPSEDDIETTRVIKELFASTSRELICHYVVAGTDAVKVIVDSAVAVAPKTEE